METPVDEAFCPIINSMIDIGLCEDIQNVVDNMMKEEILDGFFERPTNEQKEICRQCLRRQEA